MGHDRPLRDRPGRQSRPTAHQSVGLRVVRELLLDRVPRQLASEQAGDIGQLHGGAGAVPDLGVLEGPRVA